MDVKADALATDEMQARPRSAAPGWGTKTEEATLILVTGATRMFGSGISDCLIRESELEWALLSPTSVLETSLLSMVPWIEETGAIIASAGEGMVAHVAAGDVGRAGAATAEQAAIGVVCHFRAWRNGDAQAQTDTYRELTSCHPTTAEEWIEAHRDVFIRARDRAPAATG